MTPRRRRKRPRARLCAGGAGLALALLVAACGSTPERPGTPRRYVFGGAEPGQPRTNQAAFLALQNAVEERADDLARRLIAGLRRRSLVEDERELLAAYERILDGRGLVDTLELELSTVERENGTTVLVLGLSSRAGVPLTLRLPPADLEHLRVAVDARGLEGRELGTRLIDALGDLELPVEERVELELGAVTRNLGRAVAARDTWRLTPRSGEILLGDTAYPAGHLPHPRHELVTLAEGLEQAPASAEELAERFAAALLAEEPIGPELLGLAVRLPREELPAALRALAPLLQTFSDASLQTGAEVAPALRWLTRTREPGNDLAAWARWTSAWVARQDALERAHARGPLDLPGSLDDDPRVRTRETRGGLDLP
jgi:hypothetical protein